MTTGYAAIGLYSPKFDSNVGGALRAATCFDASMVVIAGRMRRFPQDTTKAYRNVPVIEYSGDIFDVIPYSCRPVAVEIKEGARDIRTYSHFDRCFYIFGPEDGSVPNHIIERCKDIIYIPTKQCMNLAATVNVVLFDRLTKRRNKC